MKQTRIEFTNQLGSLDVETDGIIDLVMIVKDVRCENNKGRGRYKDHSTGLSKAKLVGTGLKHTEEVGTGRIRNERLRTAVQ